RVVERAYGRFKLFNKSFQAVVAASSRKALREKLDAFFTDHFARLSLDRLDILEITAGIHYLPLDRSTIGEVSLAMGDLERTLLPAGGATTCFVAFRPLYDFLTDPETGKVDDGIVNQLKPKGEPVIPTRPKTLQPAVGSAREKAGGSSGGTSSPMAFVRAFSSVKPARFSGFLAGPEMAVEDLDAAAIAPVDAASLASYPDWSSAPKP
ncbi:hypothetical protein HK405_000478, partial [Cladochytrium tenue]